MSQVSKALRRWFVAHCVIDVLLAIPLLIFPVTTLKLFGFTSIDPVASRLVGAALLGIGLQSLIGNQEDASVYRAMLNLKIIWSGSCLFGLSLCLIEGAPASTWLFLGIFGVFSGVWIFFRLRTRI